MGLLDKICSMLSPFLVLNYLSKDEYSEQEKKQYYDSGVNAVIRIHWKKSILKVG